VALCIRVLCSINLDQEYNSSPLINVKYSPDRTAQEILTTGTILAGVFFCSVVERAIMTRNSPFIHTQQCD
jgi:hypothetical protein